MIFGSWTSVSRKAVLDPDRQEPGCRICNTETETEAESGVQIGSDY